MQIKVILVEPLYQINLGYMARVLKNFGINEINLVNPRCKYNGKEAVKYSKHAADLLKRVKVYKSIPQAAKGCDAVVGTTGLWYKSDKSFFNVYNPEDARKFLKDKKKIALLVGRDDTGLSKEEMNMCDASIFIPANKDYPVLNISHALAIVLYALSRDEMKRDYPMERYYVDEKAMSAITRLFWMSIRDRKDIRYKKSVLMAFKHIINRANPTKKELNALAIGIARRK